MYSGAGKILFHTFGGADTSMCRVKCSPDGSWLPPRVRHLFLCVDPWLVLRSTHYVLPMGIDTLRPVGFLSELSRISSLSRIRRIENPINHLCYGCHYRVLFVMNSIAPFTVCGQSRCQSNCPRRSTPHVLIILTSVRPNSLNKHVAKHVYH